MTLEPPNQARRFVLLILMMEKIPSFNVLIRIDDFVYIIRFVLLPSRARLRDERTGGSSFTPEPNRYVDGSVMAKTCLGCAHSETQVSVQAQFPRGTAR